MKIMKICHLAFSALFLSIFLVCAQTTEPDKNDALITDLRIELLKRIYQLDVSVNWKNEELNYFKRTGEDLLSWNTEEEFLEKLKDEQSDIRFRRAGILLLATSQLEEADRFLVEVLKNDEDDIVRFNAARALAYRGKKDGLAILSSCATGDLVLTSSSFERHAAALALLLLSEKLPQEYVAWQFADPLYLKLH